MNAFVKCCNQNCNQGRNCPLRTGVYKNESELPVSEQSLIFRLRKRAEIRRQIPGRKSVEEGTPDRIADILEEAANEIEYLKRLLSR